MRPQVRTPATLIAVREDQLVPFDGHARPRGPPQRAAPTHRNQFDIRSRRVLEGGRGTHPHHQTSRCGADHMSGKIKSRKSSGHALGARRARIGRTARLGRAADLPCRRILPSKATGEPRKYDYTRSGNPTRDQSRGRARGSRGRRGSGGDLHRAGGDHADPRDAAARRAGARAVRLLRRHLPAAGGLARRRAN